MEDHSLSDRKRMVEHKHPKLSVRTQCKLLDLNRSSVYYCSKGESKKNLHLMGLIDKIYLENPTYGVIRIQDELKDHGFKVNEKRVRRLMRLMGLEPIYPKRNLSKLGKAKCIYPYLLRNLDVTHTNQVWQIDITYIPMTRGFMYLTAIIDVYSRFLVGWKLSNTLDKENQTEAVKESIERNGCPELINSDQGSQFTCEHWIQKLKDHKITISMDGRGRATDNIYIERFFRTIKQDYVYLNPAQDGLELYRGIAQYIGKYNQRRHQGINRQKPIERYNHKKVA